MLKCFFSPKGGCTNEIVDLINKAKKEILVQAYTFTSKLITQSLIDQLNQKRLIKFIGDSNGMNGPGETISRLYQAGISCFIDAKHVIAHNKIIIIDESILITGSFNFTQSAESANAENIIILDDKNIINEYINNFNFHLSHSIKYQELANYMFLPKTITELDQE